MKKQYAFSGEEIFELLGRELVNSGELAEGTPVTVRFETYNEGNETKLRFTVEVRPQPAEKRQP